MNSVKEQKPDIIGLANYTWNLDLNRKMAEWVKSSLPDAVTVFGGSDYPIDLADSSKYLLKRPKLDFYVLGQGERGFLNVLKRYFECDSIEEMKSAPIANCAFYDTAEGRLISSRDYHIEENLGEIPSPYLTGLMDKFWYGISKTNSNH